MPAATVGLPLAEFWSDNSDWVTAVVSVVLAVAFATLLDRAFSRRGRIAEAVTKGGLNPKLDTRLRFVRRLLYATIVMIGVFIALSQFTGLSRLAASVLASGAIAAAIIGFAARQTLANVVAGIMLAITQPLRVGDWVAFEGEYGVVEDVRLNFTVLRTSADVRVIIPNERLAAGILRNDTLISDRVDLEVELWLAPDADVEQAISVLEEEAGSTVRAAEVTSDGIRLAVSGEPAQPSERLPQEAELRRRCLRRLRAEGLLASE
jgi:small-conductance mechanosensitive channel